jgi:hypothetical protein
VVVDVVVVAGGGGGAGGWVVVVVVVRGWVVVVVVAGGGALVVVTGLEDCAGLGVAGVLDTGTELGTLAELGVPAGVVAGDGSGSLVVHATRPAPVTTAIRSTPRLQCFLIMTTRLPVATTIEPNRPTSARTTTHPIM